ncbi:hypothetical protein [Paractinoplanes hotanensis]|uniref:Uncharacterized protein n=1 Tax=Paractinoplanes hotanensis TaxID=2906497 RepID=A0ABT0XS67_9ACTN|nr:hypothetical protein [Actinoplanes hotanensis]MCM4076619.1 hypothetical protein [Actinoplanes hotanensis]
MSGRRDIHLWDSAADRYAEHVNGTSDSFYRRLAQWTDYERWFATIPTMLALTCRPAPAPTV